MATEASFEVPRLGPCRFDSPMRELALGDGRAPGFVEDDDRILIDDRVDAPRSEGAPASLELAGPRRRLFFDPATVTAGIVTCGGLCPGINDVIRGLVMECWHRYGVRRLLGFQFGYRGMVAEHGIEPMALDPELVSEIHERGGTILRSSRGPQDPAKIVDRLTELRVNILFTIGGDGTLRGAQAIVDEIGRRGLPIAVVGVPKTIDNDIYHIDRSFGFETAVARAVDAIVAAHNEARGTLNGVGLVKLMGRQSGFLACHAALATSHVNFVIIPELPFDERFLARFADALHERLVRRRHAVIVVAEGAGQTYLRQGPPQFDASGNPKFADVGRFLADFLHRALEERGLEHSLKYIDPGYMLRAVQADPSDSVYCWQLAQNAVHAAMAGKTGLIVGSWHGRLVHVPIREAIRTRKQVDPTGDLWLSVLETTGQPIF